MKLEEICRCLPKIELHAHLNGSLSEATLRELGCIDDSISEYQGLLKILKKTDRSLNDCFELFKVAQNATNNPYAVYTATKNVIKEFFMDNVIYLELRTTPRAEKNMTKVEYIEAVIKAIKENENNIMVKLILSVDRRHDLNTSEESLNIIIDMKNKYPDIVKGVDLSGNPYQGAFAEELFVRARNSGLFVTIHCAEIKNDKEVKEILNFLPDRIGHATYLHEKYGGSPDTWDLYCQFNIPIECCITSNVVCGTTKSYGEHHIQALIKENVPFCICTDDKGVFCTTLSDEYLHICNSFNLSPEDLFQIVLKTVDYTFASTDEKRILREKLMMHFEEVKRLIEKPTD